MKAYLLSGLVNQYFHGHFADACSTVILYGADEERARKTFEGMLLSRNSGEGADSTRVEKVISAPVMEHLLAETGEQPVDWTQLGQEAQQSLETTAPDEQGQGYWVNCEECVRPGRLAPNVEWLQRDLPEEIRSGVNWSLDKTYFFLLSVLAPPAMPAAVIEPQFEEFGETEESDQSAEVDVAQRLATFPQMADKELAVVVRARNAIVAAWLWRKHAAGTRLAGDAIRLDPLCEVVRVGEK